MGHKLYAFSRDNASKKGVREAKRKSLRFRSNFLSGYRAHRVYRDGMVSYASQSPDLA